MAKKTETADAPVTAAREEPVYGIKELADAAGALFGAAGFMTTAALTLAGKKEYTVSEARRLVREYAEKEVN